MEDPAEKDFDELETCIRASFATEEHAFDGSAFVQKVMVRIDQAERRHVWILRTAFYAALVACCLAVAYLVRQLGQTGFLVFAQLYVTDTGLMLTSWRDGLLSLVEVFPFQETLFVLASGLALAITRQVLQQSP